MKKTLSRVLALASSSPSRSRSPAAPRTKGPTTRTATPVGISVCVSGGYYAPGWGGCCGRPVGMPRPVPY